MQKKKVAVHNGSHWSWVQDIPDLYNIKTLFKRNPSKFKIEEFYNKESDKYELTLYLLETDDARLAKALSSCLTMTGSAYALALVLAGGENGKEFRKHYANIKNRAFSKNGVEYTEIFEKLIKKYAEHVGHSKDEGLNVQWLTQNNLNVTLEHLKSLHASTPFKFHTLNGKTYYLKPLQEMVEEMYFKCVEIAGSDYALASEFSEDENERQKHVMNFKRLGFKQVNSFSRYADYFSRYLLENPALFDVEDQYA